MSEDETVIRVQYTSGHSGTGWYYWDEEYPEEGSCGSFNTYEGAISSAASAGLPVRATLMPSQIRGPLISPGRFRIGGGILQIYRHEIWELGRNLTSPVEVFADEDSKEVVGKVVELLVLEESTLTAIIDVYRGWKANMRVGITWHTEARDLATGEGIGAKVVKFFLTNEKGEPV